LAKALDPNKRMISHLVLANTEALNKMCRPLVEENLKKRASSTYGNLKPGLRPSRTSGQALGPLKPGPCSGLGLAY